MGNDSGESSGSQQVAKGQRVIWAARPAGAGEEQRGQRIQGGSRTAPAPGSVPPMSALPPTALKTQQMTPAPQARRSPA